MCKYYYLLLCACTIVLFNFSSNAQESTSKLINDALVKAKEENKYVFVNYMAASCEMSENFDKQLKSETCQPLFDTSYIMVDIVVPEDEAKQYFPKSRFTEKKNCESFGFPFWYILDEHGNFIEISYEVTGENIGYPKTKKKVEEFIGVIRKTSKLTDSKLELIANYFNDRNHQEFYSSK